MFNSRYVVDKDAIILIPFFNIVSEHYEEHFRHPISIPALKNMAGFSDLASELHRLSYFEPVRSTIIDPMHNHFLGTAKRMVDKRILSKILTDADLVEMQNEANKLTLPRVYTTITSKIGKGFPFMKADGWKSWCLVYPPAALKKHLPDELYVNWIHFVDACQLLTKPSITKNEIENAHQSLKKFCIGCEDLYDSDVLSPNMHLHLHLKETIEDFGPVYGFWLFSFEQYNGLIKGFNTNRKNGFKKTYMDKFIENASKSDFHRTNLHTIANLHHLTIFNKLSDSITGIKNTSVLSPLSIFRLTSFVESGFNPNKQTLGNESLPQSAYPLNLKEPLTMKIGEYECLLKYYRIYAKRVIKNPNFVNDRIRKIQSINLFGQKYAGSEGSVTRGTHIMARFATKDGNPRGTYAGRINYLFFPRFIFTSHSHRFSQPLEPTRCICFC
ncbi:hypothetical protein PHYBLDRAFT_171957 [Phycomyces blakesleeanus NRRL 1555(-)]|uniref:Uncharacterized protein n=1 Tax=Phycomyces blakesleeanus (strain ATCC 8743b / DSM 1359 / FGSC 10004 / NBRC 33097 / NRRL 1555) TaxID=763407 RepID=A0A162NIA7_PHYB8|nr:hypothetical protein PHYBLDRAFT_171957 [Phycomyces blakesleeanus NRRL 1555(-)]OAD69934.1 hypothetical protein PHYBLDRAFT_171957 [Phycomyces blakesleeanus NRRL 1555(-)]|eukprot:XP_018287974.1 hypothetical protein PHYBLDRAFT_171957 [Phycomyces blakesleeanus NRRL 1555(-)]